MISLESEASCVKKCVDRFADRVITHGTHPSPSVLAVALLLCRHTRPTAWVKMVVSESRWGLGAVKKAGESLFDQIDASTVNNALGDMMPKLSAKVITTGGTSQRPGLQHVLYPALASGFIIHILVGISTSRPLTSVNAAQTS